MRVGQLVGPFFYLHMREAVAGPHPQLPPAGHLGKWLPIWLGLSAGGVLFVLGWLFSILNTFCGRCAGTPWPLCGPGAHMRRRPQAKTESGAHGYTGAESPGQPPETAQRRSTKYFCFV